MDHTRKDHPPARNTWYWLLLLPFIGLVWVPFYNRSEPMFMGFPFFFWYQFLWVILVAVINAFVYNRTDR